MKHLFPLAFLLAACAEPVAAPIPEAPTFTGDNLWTVQTATVNFTGTQEGTPFTGTFADVAVDIDLDPDAPEDGRIRAVIAPASASTADAERDRALPTRDWFSTKAFPTATWESDSITRTSDGYLARGELTLKGVTRPADLPFALDVIGNTARASGTLTLQRQDYGVGAGAYSTDQWIAFPVRVDVEVEAVR